MKVARCKITILNAWTTTPLRIGDKCIMDVLQKSEIYTTEQMKNLHRTRLHLQITLLSEIITSDGNEII
jgi:hypothetical protein